HRLEGAPGHAGINAVDGLDQHLRRDLPVHAPAVLAPAAVALPSAVADDRIPVAVGRGLVRGGDLEGERLALREDRAAVEADAWDAEDGELHGQHVADLAGGEVGGGVEDATDRAVGEDSGVEAGGVEGFA